MALTDRELKLKALAIAQATAALRAGVAPAEDYRNKPIEFFDKNIKPFVVQIPLEEYFQYVKKLRPDRWQRDFMNRLQEAAINRHIKPTWAEYHAQAQLGKSVILAQTLPAWLIGHDPLFRFVLAMYNISRSEAHSEVVINILRSKMHMDIFPNKGGHLPSSVSKAGWATNARKDADQGGNDAQMSFNPVGLVSGMTGTGADWICIDDPYKEPKDAFSPTMWDNLDRFWGYGVKPRTLSGHVNIAAMFHRYNYDDFGGYLLNTGKFDYVRYASECDGDYIHEETGQRFVDPLGRKIGELICPERFGPDKYVEHKTDSKVWLSMFAGRPGKEEGEFFKVAKIGEATEADWARCALRARGWDHAASQGTGDNSAGGLLGFQPDGTVIVADVLSGQWDTAMRVEKQRETAEADGVDVTVVVPEGVSSDGKDNVFMMRQNLQGFHVVSRKVTNATPGSDAKKRRAYNFSVAMNAGKVRFLPGTWVERVKMLMRRFGNSLSGDDEIDALSDAYNHLYEEFHKGLVIKSQPTAQSWEDFAFGKQIPAHWTIYIGIKLSADATLPNCGVIAARAAENSGLTDTLFIVDEYKEYDANIENLFKWIDSSVEQRIAASSHGDRANAPVIWLHPDSTEYIKTIRAKLSYAVRLFREDDEAGIVEANWYASNDKLIGLGDLVNVKQEAATWGFNDKGEPTKTGQLWSCLRMITYAFRTAPALLSVSELIENALPDTLKLDHIVELPDSPAKDSLIQRRTWELQKEHEKMNQPIRPAGISRFSRR